MLDARGVRLARPLLRHPLALSGPKPGAISSKHQLRLYPITAQPCLKSRNGGTRVWRGAGSLAIIVASCGDSSAPPLVAGAAGALGETGATAGVSAGGSGAGLEGAVGGAGSDLAGRRDETGLQAGAAAVSVAGEGGFSGAANAAGGDAAGADAGSAPCRFAIDASISDAISTVGIVEWSLNVAAVSAAHIDFGLDTTYGLSAPVPLAAASHRTLLLGMKASHRYHARIVAQADDMTCVSDDFTLRTGSIPNGLPALTVTTPNPGAATGGYLVSSFLAKGPPFILDADGDYVWWGVGLGVGRAELSFDGQLMWYGNVNVAGGVGYISSLSMDGLDKQSHPEFGDSHHDFTVLPDETVAFIQHDGACDTIMERAPDGEVREVVNVHDAHGGSTTCHTNSLHYHVADDTYTFSDLEQNCYVKVTRQGDVVWVLGGSTSQFTGDGATWTREHGHDLILPNRLLFFNNGSAGDNSAAVEVALDFEKLTATRVWSYDAAALSSAIYGDVQRLDNGNTLIAYSTAGVVLEVESGGRARATHGMVARRSHRLRHEARLPVRPAAAPIASTSTRFLYFEAAACTRRFGHQPTVPLPTTYRAVVQNHWRRDGRLSDCSHKTCDLRPASRASIAVPFETEPRDAIFCLQVRGSDGRSRRPRLRQ